MDARLLVSGAGAANLSHGRMGLSCNRHRHHMGELWVDPKTIPAGPFLAYDHNGRLVSTIYMIPIKDFDGHQKLDDLAAPGGRVDHVSMYFNAGHPGVPEPHYHIVLWHVSKAQESAVAQ